MGRLWHPLAIGLLLIVGIGRAEEGNPIEELTDFERRVAPRPESILPKSKAADAPTGADAKAVGKAEPKAKEDGGLSLSNNRNDPFILKSRDGLSSLRFIGLVQNDYRTSTLGSDSTDIDTFQIRRGRMGFEAVVYKHFLVQFLSEFGQGQVRLLNAYGEIQFDEALRLRAGKFRQPFGAELYAITNRRAPFLERSILDQVGPNRDIGVMLYANKVFDDRLDYAVAVTNGNMNSDLDGDDRKELLGRVAVRPLNDESHPEALRRAGVGLSFSTDVNQTPINQPTLRTPFGVPWLQFANGVRLDGLRNRVSPEFSYFHRGFGLTGQYLYQTAEYRAASTAAVPVPARVTVPLHGYYVMTSLFLTGEERTEYDQWIEPLRPYDPTRPGNGLGAFELFARAGHTQFDDVIFARGVSRLADPAQFSNGVADVTLGLNWYMNHFTRFSTHYEHAFFDRPVRLAQGPEGLRYHTGTLLLRLQLTF